MNNYYADKLNASNLFKVYETKIDRVAGFLNAEIEFIRDKLEGTEQILELGSGYGRIMKELSGYCSNITGVDISEQTVTLAHEYLKDCCNSKAFCMDVYNMELNTKFDVVLCLQNGLSAIKGGEASSIVSCALRLLKDGGTAYFSSYSPKFWKHRLEWFREQSEKGLIGEIDMDKTANGHIVCKDGFEAKTISTDEFERLGRSTGYEYSLTEHDDSLVFLIIKKPETQVL